MKASKRFMVFTIGIVFGLSMLIVGLSKPALAVDPIKIRCGWTMAPTHPMGVGLKMWADKIEKDSGGRVKMEVYWSGSLVNMRQSHIELVKGVADITDFTGSYVKEGFHIEKAMRLLFYGVPVNSKLSYKIYGMLCDKYPEILAEYAAAKVLGRFSMSAYDLLLKNKPVRKAGDFQGLTIKTSGAFAHFINALGGEGARVPMGETYMALRKGTIDGALAPYETLKSWKFSEVIKYYTVLGMSTWPSGHVEMNLDVWNKLPKDIQKVFEDNIDYCNKTMADLFRQADKDGIELAKKAGVEFIELSKEDLEKVYKVAEQVVLKEAKRIDDMGLPGTKIANDARALIAQYSK